MPLQGPSMRVRGVDDVQRALKSYQRDLINEARREFRRETAPLVADMRKEAPTKSGKLESTIKPFTSSRLEGGVQYGGRAGAGAIGRFLEQYGPIGARGGTSMTAGRANEAFYIHAISKGHPMPQGGRVPANKWANRAITRWAGRLRERMNRIAQQIATRRGLA